MEPTKNNNQEPGVQNPLSEPVQEAQAGEPSRTSWWRRLLDFFFDNRIEELEAVNALRNGGNSITFFIDRYIFRRHCPYCYGYVSKRIYRERSRPGRHSKASGIPLHLPTLKIYECPHCSRELPSDFFASMSSSIAVIGGRDAGKSSFITVFCDILLNKPSILNELGIFGSILNPDGAEQFESNRWMLIDQNTTLSGTVEMQNPIVVRLQSKYHKRSMYITLIDSPGEHFEELSTLIAHHPTLQYADGIIFLMNPLDINGIVELIEQENPGTVPSRFERPITPNFNLVENLHKLYITTKRIDPNSQISVPTVFCLSRADLLEDVTSLYIPQDVDTNLAEVEDVMEEMELVASDLHELLEETDMRLLNLMAKSFNKYKLFPVSPLGKAPTGQAGRQTIIGGIEPKGILQPFIWLLLEFNFIKKR
ncbi:MAG: hypothetical protein CV087_19690 [Candidatus Brocadia sp. WS118]|nr:MAG: hypothetical protein CV087_19690 [Candidatus Brocadia sp. WS118]